MTSSDRKFSLLSGLIWNLKRWIELKQWAKRTNNADVLANAQRKINLHKELCRRVRAL